MTRNWQMPKRRNSMIQDRKCPSPVMTFFLAALGLLLDLAKRPVWSLSNSDIMMTKRMNSIRFEIRQAMAAIWSMRPLISSNSTLEKRVLGDRLWLLEVTKL